LIRVKSRNGQEVLALLDTGFNGTLLCNAATAMNLGAQPDGGRERVELADGSLQNVDRGWLEIEWLGRSRRVRVFVTAEGSAHAARDGEPVALVGGALLTPSLVLLDYDAMTVEIAEQ
jgi:predicted aspartyl protease